MEFCLRISYIVSKEVKSLLIGFKHNSAIELQDIHFAVWRDELRSKVRRRNPKCTRHVLILRAVDEVIIGTRRDHPK
jgi:hypothetical protein